MRVVKGYEGVRLMINSKHGRDDEILIKYSERVTTKIKNLVSIFVSIPNVVSTDCGFAFKSNPNAMFCI